MCKVIFEIFPFEIYNKFRVRNQNSSQRGFSHCPWSKEKYTENNASKKYHKWSVTKAFYSQTKFVALGLSALAPRLICIELWKFYIKSGMKVPPKFCSLSLPLGLISKHKIVLRLASRYQRDKDFLLYVTCSSWKTLHKMWIESDLFYS